MRAWYPATNRPPLSRQCIVYVLAACRPARRLVLVLRLLDIAQPLPDLDLLPRVHGELKVFRRFEHEHDRAPQAEAAHLLRGGKRLPAQDWRRA